MTAGSWSHCHVSSLLPPDKAYSQTRSQEIQTLGERNTGPHIFQVTLNNFCHLSLSWHVWDRRIAISSKPCQTTQWIPSQFLIWNPTPSQNLKRKQHTQTHRYISKQTNKTKTKAKNYVKQPVQLWKSTIFCSVFHFFSPIVLNLRCG